ncbi:transglycosylase domain-containing protein [Salipaludibacillus aurantiacus]|nr:transglycosylase domain-containing protein [Salipaludibacillus aurantiacus]
MRIFIGNLFILIFISVFSLLFMEMTKELSSVQSFHHVLEESVALEDVRLSSNSLILDRHGNAISDVFTSENRISLPFEKIPTSVVNAFVAAEDQSFYEHPGFDLSGIARAFMVNVQSGSIEQGGSTITQQLARNLYLSHSQNYERKLSELLYSYQIERDFSKEEIMELYINSVYFSNGVYGIEAAANYYFGLSAQDLSLAQIAFLCAVPNNPSHYNPLTGKEAVHERKAWILQKMYEQGFLENDELETALEEEIVLHTFVKKDQYPDYVTYVLYELEQLISHEEGYAQRLRTSGNNEERADITASLKARVQEVLASGITIETALVPEIQAHTVSTVNDHLSHTDTQGAVSVIDHHSSEIVAITGGTSYNKFDFHRGFQAFRQPGSAIKPLLVFAPFLEETNAGINSIIDASPIKRGSYEPQNFGGAVYGKVPLEAAFKHSYNTAAVRILDMVGVEESFSYLNNFDFSRVTSEDQRLPAALGGFSMGMSVNEMTQAYTVFAAKGIYTPPKAIQTVKNAEGDILFKWAETSKEVWNEETINKMNKMLEKVTSEGTGRAARFNTQGYIGGKTGTTNDFQDLWFIGSSSQYTAGVWIGKDEPASLYRESENNLHTNLWREIMKGFH